MHSCTAGAGAGRKPHDQSGEEYAAEGISAFMGGNWRNVPASSGAGRTGNPRSGQSEPGGSFTRGRTGSCPDMCIFSGKQGAIRTVASIVRVKSRLRPPERLAHSLQRELS